ncbi:MAG: NAD(P)-dependent oxidoreductase [Hyphomicrobiaceae bacterium]
MSFKVGVTRDLMTATGGPCFNVAAFDELAKGQDVTWEWLADDVSEILPAHIATYDALHINLPRVTAGSLAAEEPRCRIIARNGVGYDTVDIEAATARGIIVTNTPLAVRRPVAVATLTLLFALAGRLFDKDALVRTGRWNARVDYMGTGLTQRTLGLIGAGSIGREIIALARPFFGRIIAADPYVSEADIAAAGGLKVERDEVFAQADFVVACALLTPETRHIVDAAAFAKMKPTAYFVNVGRGPLHDEAALAKALASGRIAGAGLDVTEIEPLPADSPLLAAPNTIITPHALCWTDECFEDIARTALRSIADVSRGVRPRHVVNPAAAGRLEPRE